MVNPAKFTVPRWGSSSQTYDFPHGFAGGMNISVSPDQIAPNQSPDMNDCNYDDGAVPTKRLGLTRLNALTWGDTPIQGQCDFNKIGSSEPILLIAHGGKLYSYDENTDTKIDLCIGAVTSFADAPISFFSMGDKWFFLTGTEFLYYDGINPVATVQSIAYVPTVALAKNPDGTGGIANEVFNHICQKWKVSFSPNGTATVFVCDIIYLDDGITAVTLAPNLFKAWVNGVEKVENTDFTFNRMTWKVTFPVAIPQGTDTLQIQLEATNLMDTTVIDKCTRAIEHGGKNNSVVLLFGNPFFPNTVRYSWVYDPAYWPEDSDFNVGGDALPINGWGRMNEYLITYKKPGDQSVQWYSEIDLDIDGDIIYKTFSLNDRYGCIASRTVWPAQNGLLALSDQGVIWTWPQLIKGQYNCKVISRNINGKNGVAHGLLDNTAAELEKAVAVMYNNKYLLHVGNKTWVLDLDYSDLMNGAACWYPYAGLYGNAGTFLARTGRLYIGHKSKGLIYRSQLPTDDFFQNDDGAGIDSWWTCPLMFLGGRDYEKKFERLNLTFKASRGTEHILTLYSDGGSEAIPLYQEAGSFDARYFHAKYFNAGSNAPEYPMAQSEKIGVKGAYFQFQIRNNMVNRGIALLSAVVTYFIRKQIK